jgi:hypothetical protein
MDLRDDVVLASKMACVTPLAISSASLRRRPVCERSAS